MILTVHEMESRVNRPTIDGAHNLLATRRPLSPPRALRLVQTFFRKPRVLALFGHVVAGAALQMSYQVLAYGLLRRQNDGAGERQQRPMSEIDAAVGIRMIGRLLDQLEIQLTKKILFANATLDRKSVV